MSHPVPFAAALLPAAPAVLPLLASLVLRATLVLAAAGCVAWLLRRRGAALRHLVWSCAIGALLLLPALTLGLPGWDVPVWRAPVGAQEDLSLALALDAPAVIAGAGEAAPPLAAEAGLPEPLVEPAPAAGPARGGWSSGFGTAEWVVFAWLAGALLVVLRLVAGQLGVRRLRRAAEPLDPASRWLATEVAGHLGLRRSVETLSSRDASMPMTWGVVHPTVLLPGDAAEWPADRRRAVLLHEMAHVKRLDCLTQTLALLCCGLFWFHPGVWWAARRMRVEREQACDDAVLGTGFRPSDYAMHLLAVARAYRAASHAQLAAVAMAKPSQLEGRMLAVLDAARDRAGPSRRTIAVAACTALLALLPVSVLRPTARAARPDDAAVPVAAGDTIPGAARNLPRLAPADRRLHAAETELHLDEAVLHELDVDVDVNTDVDVDVDVETHLATTLETHGVRGVVADAMTTARSMMSGIFGADAPVSARAAIAHDPPRQPRQPPQHGEARRFDPRVLAGLVEALRDQDVEVRRTAAHSLGELDDPGAVAPLVQALRDADAGVRRNVAWALGQIESADAVPALVQALRDADAGVRKQAAWALGQIEDARAAEPLGAALRDASPEVRSTAAWALSQIEDPAAVPALLVALRDATPQVRQIAAHALGQIEDARAVEPLVAALRDDAAGVRSAALHALARLEDPRATEPVAALLRDPTPEVRRAAIHALGELEPRTAPQALLDAARDASAELRMAAVHSLGRIRDPRALPVLRAALRDAEPGIRRAAIHALVAQDDPAALDALIEALKDADPQVRRSAAQALGDRG